VLKIPQPNTELCILWFVLASKPTSGPYNSAYQISSFVIFPPNTICNDHSLQSPLRDNCDEYSTDRVWWRKV